MNTFLEMYNPPRLNHDKIRNLNRPITSKEIVSVINNLSTKKIPVSNDLTGEFHQTFNKELMPVLLKLFQKLKRTFSDSFYKTSITLIPKPDKYTIRKENYSIPDEYRCINSQQNISKPNSLVL